MKSEETKKTAPLPDGDKTTPHSEAVAEAASASVEAMDAEEALVENLATEVNNAQASQETRNLHDSEPSGTPVTAAFAPFPQLSEVIGRRNDSSAIPGIESFLAAVGGYMRGKNIAAADIDAHLARLFSIAYSVADGKPDLDMLELVIDGTNHAKVLAEAVAEAELRGRNANIAARMKEATQTDGLPHLASRASSRHPSSDRGIFSLAESAR